MKMYLAQVVTVTSASDVQRVGDLLARRPSLRLTVCPIGAIDLSALPRDRVELCATADTQTLLPFLRASEMQRLIAAHEARFGRAAGFLPPQLAYSHHVAEVVAELGYRWILVDDRRTRLRTPEGGEMRCHQIVGIKDLSVFFCRRVPVRDGTAEGYVVNCGELLDTPLPTCTVSDLLRLFPEREWTRLFPRASDSEREAS